MANFDRLVTHPLTIFAYSVRLMAVKWLYTHWRWRGNNAVLINVALLLGFFALDVRDLYYKTVWLGPYEDLVYDPHGVQQFDPEPLVPTRPVATLQSGDLMELPSGWPSMLERCALLHGFGFFVAALGKNCTVGPAQYPIVVPELVLGGSLRVDAVAWASCKLLYLNRRPRFCQMRAVSGFLHRYNLEDRRIPRSAMASEGSIAEMELLELLAVIASSSPLERAVCVEGFAAVNGNVSAASIYGCGSPNIFKSVLAGHYATALHSLLYDKAWLAVDELNIMGVKFVIRQNSLLTSTYRVVEESDGTSTRHTEIHSRAKFSASGPLYCLVITTDIVLLLLHIHSALQIFRHALIPQLRRRQHTPGPTPQSMRTQNPPPPRRDATSTAIGQRWSHHADFSMLSRSLYRSRPVVILTAITHLISWQVVIPSSVIWTWSVDTLDQLQSFITILRV